MNLQPVKQMPCRDCGHDVTVNAQTVNSPRCYQCGMEAAQDQMRQMHEKSGPYYDAWLKTNGPNGRRQGRGTPLDQTDAEPPF